MPRLTTRGRPARAGFTLVEILVALVILAIVGALLGTLLTQQFRIFNRTAGTSQMQRDLRTGLALLPLDVRGASRAAGDLVDLRDSSIQLRATLGSSVVCATPAATQVDLPPLGLARNTLTTWYAQPQVGDTVLLYDDSISVGPEDDGWKPRRLTAVDAAPSSACAGAPFTDATLDPPATKPRWRLTLDAARPAGMRVGAPVRFLRSVRYSLYRPNAGGQWFLGYREYLNGAWGSIEPIAGPFEAYDGGTRSGIRFVYYDTLGAAIAGTATGAQVGRIDLTLRTRSLQRGGADSLVLRDSVALRVALRNRT